MALYEHAARGARQVVACSAPAFALGVRPGMVLADAKARWRELVVWEWNRTADQQALKQLAVACHRFSPLVGLENHAKRSTIIMDITGIGTLFRGEDRLADEVWQCFHRWQWQLRLAVADTLGTAWGLSRYDERARERPLVVPPEEQEAYLAPMPIAALRLSSHTEELLAGLAIQTCGQVFDLPRAGLAARFPAELLQRIEQALGTRAEPFPGIDPPRTFCVHWEFEYPTAKTEIIFAVLAQLADRLSHALQQVRYGALELSCVATCEPRRNVVANVGMVEPTSQTEHWLELLRLRLERLRFPAPVVRLQLEAVRTALLVGHQGRLFADDEGNEPREFLRLVNRLAGRLGNEAVVRATPSANSQPELAYHEMPLVEMEERRRTKTPSAQPRHAALERPTQLLPRPVPLQVMAVTPDGPPIRFQYAGRDYRAIRHIGPERIETSWWRKAGVRRDYYQVETTGGERFWLFRNLADDRWYLHGEFA